ncbi:hypothetical protein [Deinococcus ruber]|uniref:Uncharacterized protein n=1 Tax=Deinococcus ruber TaxID=1848197 RepID=A0A918C928_9DEIO|nr:hypothetical protein [Deinococcus ruber]GGR13023.1 hypothetical protein GCM10008957_27470 [Deinococcus ruber]
MSHPTEVIFARPTRLLVLSTLLITLPFLSAYTYRAWRDGRNATHLVEVCQQFVTGQAGWRLANDTLTDALTFSQSAAPNLAASYEQALQNLQDHIQSTPSSLLRFHALPVYPNRGPLGGEQRLVGPTLALTSQASHSPPGASALYIDLPWKGGAFVSLDLTGPCGTYHQQFSLFQSGQQQGVVTILTTQFGQLVTRQYLSVTY